MTIDGDWLKILKTEASVAFQDSLPEKTIHTVFIDGQIKLMKPDYIKTWDMFIHIQFVKIIQRHFDSGCKVVVLGFDNYKYVPLSKAPTQRKRSKHMPNFDFTAQSELPKLPPTEWNQAMRNRIFKTKIIQMIQTYFERNYADVFDTSKHTLIFDYMDTPVVLGNCSDNFEGFGLRRGECDIKAFDYMCFPSLLIDSTDGDYVPMAMIQYQQKQLANTPCQIFLKRLKVNTDKKRKASARREYEFVNVKMLVDFVHCKLSFSCDAVKHFAILCSMAGCDFAMNIPLLGPTRLWKNIQAMPAMESTHFDVEICKYVLSQYCKHFSKHHGISANAITDMMLCNNVQNLKLFYEMLLQRLSKTTVKKTVDARMWDFNRLFAHCKNVSWTYDYWSNLSLHEDPLSLHENGTSKWGYVWKKNIVVFDNNND